MTSRRYLLACLVLFSLPAMAEETNWADRIAFNGDIRLRYESIEQDAVPDRDRSRYRVRLGLKAQVYDDIRFVLSLATGADNPVSRNVTFGDSFGVDDFGLELAYVDWQVNDNWQLFAGKMKNPMLRAGGAPLVYDGDLNPEGVGTRFSNDRFFVNAGAFFVEERSTADDTHLLHAQAGVRLALGGASELTAGAGYFTYTNTMGNRPFHFSSARGNSVDGNNRYIYDYANSEFFAELDTRVGQWPLQVYAHYTVNHEVVREDTAYAVGVTLGSNKKQGDTRFSWTYQDVEADSVIAAFNDSDFGGGGTDSDGHILKGSYMLRDRISLGGTLMLNKVDGFSANERDYQRLQLDIEFKFQ